MSLRIDVEDCVGRWEDGGKSDFVAYFKNKLQEPNSSLELANSNRDTKKAVYKLCLEFVSGKLSITQIVAALSVVMPLSEDFPSLMSDVFQVINIETAEDQNRRDNFVHLIKVCNDQVVPNSLLMERLDFAGLVESSLVPKTVGAKKFIKLKTKMFYKQNKFNLFREASEGYGKLITELFREQLGNTEYVLEVIHSLIGCFSLDPNRVIDIILEVFENRLDQKHFFVDLLKSFEPDPRRISQLMSFKLSLKLDTENIFALTALLLKHQVIKLESIYNYLSPSAEEIQIEMDQKLQDAQTFARKLNPVNLSQNLEDDSKEYVDLTNQKLGLCAALISVDEWALAKILIDQCPEYYAVSQPHVSRNLCDMINYIMDDLFHECTSTPIERKNLPSRSFAKVSTLEMFRKIAFPLILELGPFIYRDPILMCRILKIFSHVMAHKETFSKDLEYDLMTLLGDCLFPALSLLDYNYAICSEIWSVIKLLPYSHRYSIYHHSKNANHSTQPDLIRAKAKTIKNLKYATKRLSLENVKYIGKMISKLCNSNPQVVFAHIFEKIQESHTFIASFVAVFKKYRMPLAFDILSFCAIELLKNPLTERIDSSGTAISSRFQNLAQFFGHIFNKCSTEMTGVLQHVMNQLKEEIGVDLLVLKEIIHKMSGIEFLENMTEEQLQAMSGGENLQRISISNELASNESFLRLKNTLLEQDMALPLCLLIAQQRNCLIFKEDSSGNKHIKLTGNLFDQTHNSLVQLSTFLSTEVKIEEYIKQIPPLKDLLTKYHISDVVAFFLARPKCNYLQKAAYLEAKKRENDFKNLGEEVKIQRYTDAVNSVLIPISKEVESLHSPETWKHFSTQFYVTFWSLSIYDLSVPTDTYKAKIEMCTQLISKNEISKDKNEDKKVKKLKREMIIISEKLTTEERKQKKQVKRVEERLQQEKDNWFVSQMKGSVITEFMKLCIFPRCTFTAQDALFCAKFIHTLHVLKTPNFSTIVCLDRIFKDVSPAIMKSTEAEARHYGNFLGAILKMVMKWHGEKAIFDKECRDFPGFINKIPTSNTTCKDSNDYEIYRYLCKHWHSKMLNSLLFCLESKEYILIRNSLSVMIKILPSFPLLSSMGETLLKTVENLVENEKESRPDLWTMATTYYGVLKQKSATFLPEEKFCTRRTVAPVAKKRPREEDSVIQSEGNAKSTLEKPKAKIQKTEPVIQTSEIPKSKEIREPLQIAAKKKSTENSQTEIAPKEPALKDNAPQCQSIKIERELKSDIKKIVDITDRPKKNSAPKLKVESSKTQESLNSSITSASKAQVNPYSSKIISSKIQDDSNPIKTTASKLQETPASSKIIASKAIDNSNPIKTTASKLQETPASCKTIAPKAIDNSNPKKNTASKSQENPDSNKTLGSKSQEIPQPSNVISQSQNDSNESPVQKNTPELTKSNTSKIKQESQANQPNEETQPETRNNKRSETQKSKRSESQEDQARHERKTKHKKRKLHKSEAAGNASKEKSDHKTTSRSYKTQEDPKPTRHEHKKHKPYKHHDDLEKHPRDKTETKKDYTHRNIDYHRSKERDQSRSNRKNEHHKESGLKRKRGPEDDDPNRFLKRTPDSRGRVVRYKDDSADHWYDSNHDDRRYHYY